MLFDDDVLIRNRMVVAAPLSALERNGSGNYVPKEGMFDHITRVQTMTGDARVSAYSFSVVADRLSFRSICSHCHCDMVIAADIRKTPIFCSERCSKRGTSQARSFTNTCAHCGG